MRQSHIPNPLTFVHLQNDAGVGGRMVDGILQEKKVWPKLRDGNGLSADEQAHFHLRGMAAVR